MYLTNVKCTSLWCLGGVEAPELSLKQRGLKTPGSFVETFGARLGTFCFSEREGSCYDDFVAMFKWEI